VISKGSCDTEGWSNDAENSALITGINYILIEKMFTLYNITLYYCIFDQVNAGLVSRRLKNKIKIGITTDI